MNGNINRKKDILVVILLILFFTVIVAWFLGIRTVSARLNFIFLGIALPLPTICFFLAFRKYRLGHILNKVAIGFLLFLAIISALAFCGWLFLVTFWLPDVMLKDIDRSFELTRTVKIDNEIYRVYTTNCGATCAFGVVVRKETEILPGFFYVKNVGDSYGPSDAEISKNPDGSLKIDYTY